MSIAIWDARYRSGSDLESAPSPLVVETVRPLKSGRALDLACGTGGNAIWLASHGWEVTAVDGSSTAIEILRRRAAGLGVDARIADLEKGEYRIEASRWDLILMYLYLQRDLFEPARRGLLPGGVLIAVVLMAEPGEEPGEHRLKPGELSRYFDGCEILHSHEGRPTDPARHGTVAEIVVRRGLNPA